MSPIASGERVRRRPPLIAVVGADGSGKTTLAQSLLAWMETLQPTRLCHLGKQTGNWGRKIASLPVYGRAIDKKVLDRAASARAESGAGLPTATVIFMLSMRRVLRFVRMRRLHSKGYAILTDRFPQAYVPGPMDGPGLVARWPHGWVTRKLTSIEQKLYNWMATYKPDLVIRLNVDFETARARKPDHRPDSLMRKIEDVPRLRFDGSPILDLSARAPFEETLEQAKAAILLVLQGTERTKM